MLYGDSSCFIMKVFRVFSLESPHFQNKKEKQTKLSRIYTSENFSLGLKNEFETAMVKEPSVFDPLKFYCRLNSVVSITGQHNVSFTYENKIVII